MALLISEKIKLPRIVPKQPELKRLLGSLETAFDYTAFFAVSDSFSRQKNLYKEIKRKFSGSLKLIELKKTVSLIRQLEEHSQKSPAGEVFYILGLDVLLGEVDPDKKAETLDILRNRPDDLVELNRPLIFAIPIHLVSLLHSEAPDFWEWRHGIFLFEERFEKQELQFDFITDQFFNSFGAETHRRKKELLELFHFLAYEKHYREGETPYLLYLKTLNYLGVLAYELGNYQDALQYYQEFRKLLEPFADEFILGLVSCNIGKIYERLGSYQQARGIYKRVLKKYKKSFREDYIYRSLIWSNIGWTDHYLGNDNEALRHGRHALGTIENNFNPYQIHLAPVLNLMGNVYPGVDEAEEALDCFRRALQICEKHGGLDHPYIAAIMYNIGLVYKQQGKYEEARSYFYNWLEKVENYYGAEHPQMAVQIFIVGQVHFEQQKYHKALRYFEWALSIIRGSADSTADPNAGRILCYIGKSLLKQGRIEEAKEYLNLAQEIFHIQLPADHPFIKDGQNDIKSIAEEPKSEKEQQPS